jgi:hypothetical protein
MAKDKEVEKVYKTERLARTVIRKARRRALRKIANKYKACPYCGRSPWDNDDCW